VVARDHHRVIPCQQGTDTQQCNCALCHSTPNCRRRTVTPSARAYQSRSAPASLSVCERRDRPEVTSAKFAAVEGTMRHRGPSTFHRGVPQGVVGDLTRLFARSSGFVGYPQGFLIGVSQTQHDAGFR
jgi:hypothetical protein